MAIKQIPVTLREYYKAFHDAYKDKYKAAIKRRDELEKEIIDLKEVIEGQALTYKEKYDIEVHKYTEFEQNKFISGLFHNVTKNLLMSSTAGAEDFSLFILHDLASKQKEIHKLTKDLTLYEKCAAIKFVDYREIIKAYYLEVQRHMILEGEGYAYAGDIGWICINRCEMPNAKPTLDYKATKEREKELKARGAKIYNKAEAEWCAKNGFEYKAEDKRVFVKREVTYQVPLLSCHLPDAYMLEFNTLDSRPGKYRGLTNEDLLEMAHNNMDEVCNLEVDMKTKLHMCLKITPTLYTKFIRNENQKPVAFRTYPR